MVQYVITPWRSSQELLDIRQALYHSNRASDIESNRRHSAVSLISVWVQRGNCPHLIESTALLVSAQLNDSVSNSAYALRGAYSAAFCRFVTGLLDGYQDKRHKMSMYSIARNIGLPATFVELRHQCTHEELPPLQKLRAAAERSLGWIWEYYWQSMEVEGHTKDSDIAECRTTVKEYLRWRADHEAQDEGKQKVFATRLRRWDTNMVLQILVEISDERNVDPELVLEALRLERAIMNEQADRDMFESLNKNPASPAKNEQQSMEEIRAEMSRARVDMETEADTVATSRQEEEHRGLDGQKKGWAIWNGSWTPRPIGIV